ncbi:MAG: TIGR03915 family putative DNA repair protein [Coriobacteriales bacterium]|jgi:probable DNA metabolism protein|nr:TIGR03915 family putative DNA repair protein [Coriobacteriales bacterium]
MNALMDDAQPVYLYDGTLEGMLTAVFEAFARREAPLNVAQEHCLQQSLLCSYIPILTDAEKAERVQVGVINKLGERAYDNIKQVFLSDDGEKGGVIVRYLLYTMRKGRGSCAHLANPAVNAFEEVLRQVSKEAHYMLQFVRFAQLRNGVYFSRIEPKASVVPLIMGHFAARFNVQPFMIYDARHGLSGVFDTERWWLVDARDIQVPEQTMVEDAFQSLWQTFYDTIAIEERRNPTCQRNFMPKRFWGTMCEQIPPQLRNLRPKTATPTQAAKQLAARNQTPHVLSA